MAFELSSIPPQGTISSCHSGNCTSVSFEPKTRHLLMSCRPTPKLPFVTHTICSLDLLPGVEGDSSCSLNMVQVFHGGPTQVQLSRSCLCTDPEDASNFWAVAGDETCKAVSDFSVQVVAIGSICSSCALGKGMALSQAPDIESQTLLIHRKKKRTVRGSNETQ